MKCKGCWSFGRFLFIAASLLFAGVTKGDNEVEHCNQSSFDKNENVSNCYTLNVDFVPLDTTSMFTRVKKAIESSKRLYNLRLRANQITAEQGKELLDSLLLAQRKTKTPSENADFEVFTFRENPIDTGGFQSLGGVLTLSTGLRYVDLRGTIISDESAKLLAEIFAANNHSFEAIYLENCKISEDGIGVIARALCKNTALKVLHASFNPFGDAGVIELAKAIEAQAEVEGGLQEVTIKNSNMGPDAMERLALAGKSNPSCGLYDSKRERTRKAWQFYERKADVNNSDEL